MESVLVDSDVGHGVLVTCMTCGGGRVELAFGPTYRSRERAPSRSICWLGARLVWCLFSRGRLVGGEVVLALIYLLTTVN